MSQLYAYLFCLISLQGSLLERKVDESAKDFVLRQFHVEQQQAILELHPIIEYAWGDTRKGQKILCFIPAKFTSNGMMQACVFLPQGKHQYQTVLIDRILFTGGGEPEQVITVFFEDIDGNGDKELLFIKKASVKDYKDLVTEDGSLLENVPHRRSVYSTFIYRQKKSGEDFLPAFEAITWPYLFDRLQGLQTASAVRAAIQKLRD
ncbi:MAG: hypothetical protein HRU41_00835 [Saprospiraceae bacterium]|nr:hypothetical protein [Saprospiraceae bacterium]